MLHDPQEAVASQAYLLFYRRQSAEPLGGPVLQEIIANYKAGVQHAEDEDDDAGDDQNYGDSRNGSSNVLGEAVATRPSDDENEVEHEPENPLDSMFQEPTWSFGPANSASVSRPGSSNNDDDNTDLFGDNDSTAAVGDDDSEVDTRLEDVDVSGPVSEAEGSFEDVPPLQDDGTDDELPVVELRVGDDDKMATDS